MEFQNPLPTVPLLHSGHTQVSEFWPPAAALNWYVYTCTRIYTNYPATMSYKYTMHLYNENVHTQRLAELWMVHSQNSHNEL